MVTRLQHLLDGMLQDRSWPQPSQLGRRIDMLERLERWLVHHGDTMAPTLVRRAETLMQELEAINHQLYQAIRDDIRRGQGANSLLPWVAATPHDGDAESYDPLDALVSGVLDLAEPVDVSELEAEMVFYQPTPARHIFDFMARAAIDARDTVIDLGAGLGHVTLLTAICTPARCIGIEWQAAYVASARQCAQALNVCNATFLAQDVRQARLAEGTVFYLYTPFTGALLRTVLDMLAREAGHRAIRLCSLGPCTEVLAKESWLSTDDACDPRRPALFRSR
ncbi:MAG TPA: class I SAM-dependent methyltransferase [Dyella sp.]|uniref:class I SAM-dependent methyltransferase n=1 Tax=Dyella sp. TaxID=1869338 RepID=UPI002B8406CC|nr:class I SAM-dependent methyltransferase [Dyella sp.]HUB89632.1 class I SAM-dependent methyltransferase [Dyella sp.]